MEKDGILLYGEYPELIGKNLFTDKIFDPFTGLADFAKKAAAQTSGEGSYKFYASEAKEKIVPQSAIWGTVGLYDNEWRVVVVKVEK